MVNLLNHKIEETIPIIQGVLQQLISSHEIMYSTILTRRLKLVISKVQGELTAQQYDTLNDLCDQIMARFKMSQATFMNDYTTFSNSLIDTMEFTQSLNIFQVGQEHFDIALSTKQFLFCKIINVNYEMLNAKEKELFKKDLIEANLLDANAQLIISQFSRELLIVMAIIPPTQKRLPVEKIVSSEATYLLYDPTTEVFTNFHELFNYVFFNQLLEIDIDPFKKSLA